MKALPIADRKTIFLSGLVVVLGLALWHPWAPPARTITVQGEATVGLPKDSNNAKARERLDAEARNRATRDARNKAKLTARGLHAKVGRVVSAKEAGGAIVPGAEAGSVAGASTEALNYRLDVVFEIE